MVGLDGRLAPPVSTGPDKKARQGLRIVHLLDAPWAAPILARLFVEEWAPWYGPGGGGDAERDLAACGSRTEMPICLVALGADGAVLGTAALKRDSVGDEHGVGPWLAALLVDKDERGLRIGSALIAAIEGEARTIGLDAVYCSADAATSILTRRGWAPFGESESLRGPVTVYRLRLLAGDEDRS